ncbi:MAG: tetratricopeptide repeat-containing glycosyltransferase family protein, partial [Burkholderiales bacterium]
MSVPAWLAFLLPRRGARGAPAAPLDACAEDARRGARVDFDAGLAAYASQDYTTAIVRFKRVLESRHDDADAHNNLGLSHLGLGHNEDALDAFVLATHFRPHFPGAFYNMALAALHGGDFKQAVTSLEQALELDPEFVAAHSTLGYVLTHLTGDFERGAAHIRRALAISPDDVDALCNYSAVLAQAGNAEDAIGICLRLLTEHPSLHEARLNLSLARLKLGRFAEAWPDYEARKLARGNYIPRALDLPEWRGEPLQNRKLLIYAEQGIGDQIMFASCVPDVLDGGAACMLECAPQLVPLFTRSFPLVTVVPQAQADAVLARVAREFGVDYAVAVGSLPAHFRNDVTEFPGGTGYLRAAPARVEFWSERLAALGPGLKIGISWSGGAPSTRGAERSTQLSAWTPILQQRGCHFVSLQYGEAGTQLPATLRGQTATLHDWREAIDDYDETAALVAALDLVITVQTALVHLAGALGTPAWVMLRSGCEWRYGEHGETMPWYPRVRLLRQPRAGDWNPVIARVA